MIRRAKISLVLLLAACIVACGLPRPAARAGALLPRGASSAKAAASRTTDPHEPAPAPREAVAAGEPVLAFGALAAFDEPDTTEFDFPDEDREHLARDITVWVIASAFVAVFLIKVFLEEEEDEPEDDGPPGKQI